MVESTSTDADVSDPNEIKKDLTSADKFVRIYTLGRKALPRMIRYTDNKLKPMDIRLLKGFYVQC